MTMMDLAAVPSRFRRIADWLRQGALFTGDLGLAQGVVGGIFVFGFVVGLGILSTQKKDDFKTDVAGLINSIQYEAQLPGGMSSGSMVEQLVNDNRLPGSWHADTTSGVIYGPGNVQALVTTDGTTWTLTINDEQQDWCIDAGELNYGTGTPVTINGTEVDPPYTPSAVSSACNLSTSTNSQSWTGTT